MSRILLSGRLHDDGMAVLAARPDVEVIRMPDEEPLTFLRLLPTADALIIRTAQLPREALVNIDRLKVVSRHGVGYDNIPVDALTAKGVPVALAIGANADSVAEHVLFLLLAVAKQGLLRDRSLRAGDWEVRNRPDTFELKGKTLLVIGFGRIGRTVARLAAGIGMKVAAFDPLVDAENMTAANVEKVEDWRGRLGDVHALTLHVPRTQETENMIGAPELSLMRSDAILVNTARGGLVDEAALATALDEGRIAGAGIDTFDHEPPAPDDPLLRCARAVLSPHSAGLTRESFAALSVITVENALAAIDGRLDPAYVVNPSVLKT